MDGVEWERARTDGRTGDGTGYAIERRTIGNLKIVKVALFSAAECNCNCGVRRRLVVRGLTVPPPRQICCRRSTRACDRNYMYYIIYGIQRRTTN